MKLNKQLMKKINSPKTLFIFVFLIIVVIIIIHFVFKAIRVIFDMDKKEENKLNKKPNPLALKAIEHLQKFKEEEERIQKLIEEENRKLKEEEDRIQAELKAIEDKKNKKKRKKIIKN